MPYALLIARLLLSAVFGVAGVAKLADQAGSRQALVAFGVPSQLAGPGGILLPVVELGIAVLLLPVATAWASAIGALSLLLCFLLVIGISLALGRKPDCHCFGQLHSAPAGWSTLARNVVLASAAGYLVWHGRIDPGPSLVSWIGDLTASERVALLGGYLGLALLIGQAALLIQILKQQGRILLRLDALDASATSGGTAVQSQAAVAGLPIGSPAPGFRLEDLDGKFVTLEDLLASAKPAVLLFTNPNCGPCQALLPEVGRWHREHSATLAVALISEGTAADNRTKTAEQGLSRVLLQKKREVADTYHAWGTPAAVVIRPDGTIGSPVARGSDAIRALVAQSAVRALPSVPVAKLGDLAPRLELADLNGKTVPLAAFRGRDILLVFWNPRCGFCQRMLSDLKDWDADPPPGAPALVVVSAGTTEDARAMGLRSPVLRDPTGQASGPFGANGTPTGILIDARGRIASEIAGGAQAVFELAGKRPEYAGAT